MIYAHNGILSTLEKEGDSDICIFHILFIHSSINRHLVCLHLLAIVDHASVNMGGQIAL